MDTGLVGFWFIATRWLWLVESIPFALNVRHTAQEPVSLIVSSVVYYQKLMIWKFNVRGGFLAHIFFLTYTYFKILMVEERSIKKSMPKELFSHLSKFLKCVSVVNCVSQPIGNYNNISFAFHLMVFWIDLISNKQNNNNKSLILPISFSLLMFCTFRKTSLQFMSSTPELSTLLSPTIS